MSVLAFFPWFTIPAPATVGSFRLVPHRVGASLEAQPGSSTRSWRPTRSPAGAPVESATLVQVAGRPSSTTRARTRRPPCSGWADAVAFAALARRGFFEAGPT